MYIAIFFSIATNRAESEPSQHITHFQQDRQCTCNVILRRVRAITVIVEKGISITYMRYPACGAHAP